MMMKQGIRILALNDSPFSLSDKATRIIGIVGRAGVIEGVLSFDVTVNGIDSTKKIISAIRKSRFAGQIKVLALNGTVIAGMNAIDIGEIRKRLGIEPIAITRKRPRHGLLEAVAKRRLGAMRANMIRNLNSGLRILKIGNYYVQLPNLGSEKPSPELVELCVSLLRLAHIVASGVARGESKGRL
ncbi:MAG: DUF99 family protein [Candidatus Micrarchaeaceae archaeon]